MASGLWQYEKHFVTDSPTRHDRLCEARGNARTATAVANAQPLIEA